MDRQIISFTGLGRRHLGIALWQADGSGLEPEAVGHTFQTPIGPITAHYYSASRDYDRIDPDSIGALVATAPVVNFDNFLAALSAAEFTLSDVVIKFGLATPTGDSEGRDWIYQDDVETRHIRLNGPFILALGDEPMVEFIVERMTLTENYQGARSFKDVRISLTTDPITAKYAARTSGVAAQKVAEGFLADVAGAKLRLTIDEIRLTTETFDGYGRFRTRFADLIGARLITV